MVVIPPEARAAAEAATADHLGWLAHVMLTDGDRLGALLAALLLRHLALRADSRAPGNYLFEDLYLGLRAGGHLEAATKTAATYYAAAPIDKLLSELKAACEGNADGQTSQEAGLTAVAHYGDVFDGIRFSLTPYTSGWTSNPDVSADNQQLRGVPPFVVAHLVTVLGGHADWLGDPGEFNHVTLRCAASLGPGPFYTKVQLTGPVPCRVLAGFPGRGMYRLDGGHLRWGRLGAHPILANADVAGLAAETAAGLCFLVGPAGGFLATCAG